MYIVNPLCEGYIPVYNIYLIIQKVVNEFSKKKNGGSVFQKNQKCCKDTVEL